MALTINGTYTYTKPLDTVYVDSEGNLRDLDVPSARGTIQLPEVTVSMRNPRKYVSAFDGSIVPWLEISKIITAPLNTISPSQQFGAVTDAVQGKRNYFDSLLNGNSGFFTDKYEQNHPYITMAGNLAGDIISGVALSKIPEVTRATHQGIVLPGMKLFNSPLTGDWTKIGNREYRLSPNSFGVNSVPLESRAVTPQITTENAAKKNINVEHSLDNISRFEGSSPIPTGHQGTVGYRPKQKTTVWDSTKQDMVQLKSIDEVPNLRETINSILRRIKTEDIRPEFLNENAYVNAFRDNATRQGININDLSHEDVAKILTEQYNQLREGSSGILKNNILWRTWGRTRPQAEFNWQEHLGEFENNKGFWGGGNYFSTGVYGNNPANQPYMITGIKEIGYDDLLGATEKAGDAVREGKIAGEPLATKWMSESPDMRIVAATKNGHKNRYGWLDTGDQGIEIVTQKNTGIKALNPDLTIGNGKTFPRDWSNPNVFKGLLPFLGLGAAGTLYKNLK